jgi:hypothetical protein
VSKSIRRCIHRSAVKLTDGQGIALRVIVFHLADPTAGPRTISPSVQDLAGDSVPFFELLESLFTYEQLQRVVGAQRYALGEGTNYWNLAWESVTSS